MFLHAYKCTYTGTYVRRYRYIHTYVCKLKYHRSSVFTGPSVLTLSIAKNVIELSIIVQWDEVDDLLPTTYIVTWTGERDHIVHPSTLIEQSSYTITGLTLDTVYTITVTASNRCGQGPETVSDTSFTTGKVFYK